MLAAAAAAAAPSTLVPHAQSGRDTVASTLRVLGGLGDANAPGATSAPRREGFVAAAGEPTISAPPDMIVSEGPADHTINLVVKLFCSFGQRREIQRRDSHRNAHPPETAAPPPTGTSSACSPQQYTIPGGDARLRTPP